MTLARIARPLLLAAVSTGAAAAQETLYDLDLPQGANRAVPRLVSADGETIIGVHDGGGTTQRSFLWTPQSGAVDMGVLAGAPTLFAPFGEGPAGLSDDASVIAGTASRPTGELFAYRHAGGAATELGNLGVDFALASAISGDGDVIVGTSSPSTLTFRAFRWTAGGGMQDLGVVGSFTESRAFGVNGDGSVVVGRLLGGPGPAEAFRWTAQTGIVPLGSLMGLGSFATAVSADGEVVVGFSTTASGGPFEAFRWTAQTGMVGLGALPGLSETRALDVDADGSVIVGLARDPSDPLSDVAFRWTESGGIELLEVGGVSPRLYPGGMLSEDGSVVAGYVDGAPGAFTGVRYETGAGAVGQDVGAAVAPNSTGAFGRITGTGSLIASENNLRLSVDSLPAFATCIFVVGSDLRAVPLPVGAGALLVVGSVGRYAVPGTPPTFLVTGPDGRAQTNVDLSALPIGAGAGVPVMAGETWYFQAWHREDPSAGGANLTNALGVSFL